MSVGHTIWDQITIATKVACGARQILVDDTGLQFVVTVRPSVTHKIIVRLMPDDLYTVSLIRIPRRGFKVTTEHEAQSIQVENLSDTIYRMCNP